MKDSGIQVVNMSLVQKQIKEFAQHINKSVGEVTCYVFGLWVNDVMKQTPPYSAGQLRKMVPPANFATFAKNVQTQQAVDNGEVGKAFDVEGFSMGARQVGTRRVRNDISKVIGPLPENFHSWEDDKNLTVTWISTPEKGGKFGMDRDLYRPNADLSQVKSFHSGNRSMSTGRTSQRKTTSSIGKWKFIDKMFVNRRIFEQYVKAQQAAVGALKAGWMGAIGYFKGRNPPSWVSNNPRKARGKAGGEIKANGSGEIWCTNDVPYARRLLQGIADSSARTRQRDLEKWARVRADKIIESINKQSAAMSADLAKRN